MIGHECLHLKGKKDKSTASVPKNQIYIYIYRYQKKLNLMPAQNELYWQDIYLRQHTPVC